MKKIFGLLLFFCLIALHCPQTILADAPNCEGKIGNNITITGWPTEQIWVHQTIAPLTFKISGLNPNSWYETRCRSRRDWGKWVTMNISDEYADSNPIQSDASGVLTWTLTDDDCWNDSGTHLLSLTHRNSQSEDSTVSCELMRFEVTNERQAISCPVMSITDKNGKSGCFEVGEQFDWKFQLTTPDGKPIVGRGVIVESGDWRFDKITDTDGYIYGTNTFSDPALKNDVNFQLIVDDEKINNCKIQIPSKRIKIDCTEAEKDQSLTEQLKEEEEKKFNLCEQIPDSDTKLKCNNCYNLTGEYSSSSSNSNQHGLWSAVGCIKTDSGSIVQASISIGLSIAGGVVFLLIIVAGFMLSTSRGDSKRVSDAKEMLTNAIIGLIFIVFSITILRFIGVTILQIPEFGGSSNGSSNTKELINK